MDCWRVIKIVNDIVQTFFGPLDSYLELLRNLLASSQHSTDLAPRLVHLAAQKTFK